MKRWLAAAALGAPTAVVTSLAIAAPWAHADTSIPTVVVLRPAETNEVTSEALVRVQGELEAAGFDVAVLPMDAGDPKGEIETAGRDLNPVAAFAIFVSHEEDGTSTAEIWVSDRVRQKTVIQRATLPEGNGGRSSAILAVRAVELLKASLTSFWAPAVALPSPPNPAPPAPAPRDAAPAARAAFASGWGAGVGVGLVESFGAVGPTWAPNVMVSYGWESGLSLRAGVYALGPDLTLTAAAGSARVEQQLTLVEAVKTWWPRAAWVPFVVAGAGAQHIRVAGSGVSPYEGTTSNDWSLLTTVGAGVGVPLLPWLSVVFQTRAMAAWPSTVVRIAGSEVGRVGAPSLLADGGLLGVLR